MIYALLVVVLVLAGLVARLVREVEELQARLVALETVAVTHPNIAAAFSEAADKAAAAVLKRPGFGGGVYIQKGKGLPV